MDVKTNDLAGAFLRRERKRAGMTYDELHKVSGYSVTYLSKIERGEIVPSIKTVAVIAQSIARAVEMAEDLARRTA